MDFRNHLSRLGTVALLALALLLGLSATAFGQQAAEKGEAWREHALGEFLDRHPSIAQDLNKNPNLVNDQEYLSKHPELRQFLDQHPGIKKEVRENPSAFLQAERKEQKSEAGPNKYQVHEFGEFLEQHPDISRELHGNPNLVNDQNYMSKHPELNQFLNQHPGIKNQLLDHPAAFLQDMGKEEKGEPGPNKYQARTFGEFLEQHPAISQELSRNPNLVRDPNYMSKHPELNQFLAQHPGVKEQLLDNPAGFIRQAGGTERNEKQK